MSDGTDPDPTVVDAAPAAGGGSGGEPPPVGEEAGEDWYRNPKVLVAIAAVVVLLVVGAWLVFGSDDDEGSGGAPAPSTTTSTTSTTVAPAPAAPAEEGDADGGADGGSASQAESDLAQARQTWAGQPAGAEYILQYVLESGGQSSWCVRGFVGDESRTEPFAQGQGCGTNDFPDPVGTLGVGGWHDFIADAIARDALVSATYDPTGRPSVVRTTDAEGFTATLQWLVPPGG